VEHEADALLGPGAFGISGKPPMRIAVIERELHQLTDEVRGVRQALELIARDLAAVRSLAERER
jgi:hypothetical protein